jgi:hypothetical protein
MTDESCVMSTDVQPPHPLAISRKCGTSSVINSSMPSHDRTRRTLEREKIERRLTVGFQVDFAQRFFEAVRLETMNMSRPVVVVVSRSIGSL